MGLVLHAHPLSSYCWKVLIALYENETRFTFQHLDLSDAAARDAFLALWPIGRMPVLVDEGRAVLESSVIIEHLMIHHSGAAHLLPNEAAAALPVRMLDRIFDNYLMTPMQRIVADRLRAPEQRDPVAVAEARRQIETSYDWLEGALANRIWAAGEDFSLADCAAAPSLYYADAIVPIGDRPVLAAFLDRLRARPSFARVLEEAAPWQHLFPRGD